MKACGPACLSRALGAADFMSWNPSEIIGAILGAAAALPLSVWGFVVGGDFIGAATRGWLAIPGAVFGAGLVIFGGAFIGSITLRTAVALVRKRRQERKP